MKRIASLMLIAVMLLTIGIFPAAADEPVELVIYTDSLDNGFPLDISEDWVHDRILEKTGVSIRFSEVDDYYTVMGQRLAGGDMPDLMRADSLHMRMWQKEGMLKDLTPYMENELAGLIEWCGDVNMTPFFTDGKLYALPKAYVNAKSYLTMNIRTDWLENLNLKVPTTVQELYDVAYAFDHNDPDGNGVDDTYGITSQKGFFAYDAICGAYDTALGNYIIVRDGKVTNALLQPGMKDALAWCKKFQEDGLIDKECYTTSGTNRAKSGEFGIILVQCSSMFKQAYRDQVAAINPNAEWHAFGALNSEVGAENILSPLDIVVTNAYCVSADITEEKLAGLFRVIDFLTTEEGQNLVYFGEEGAHWEKDENGVIHMTDRATEANYIATYQLFGRDEAYYLETKFPEAWTEFQQSMVTRRLEFYNSLVEEPEHVYVSDMESYINGELLNFIYGDRPLEEYDEFIQYLYDYYDFGDYMDKAAEDLAAQGVV